MNNLTPTLEKNEWKIKISIATSANEEDNENNLWTTRIINLRALINSLGKTIQYDEGKYGR